MLRNPAAIWGTIAALLYFAAGSILSWYAADWGAGPCGPGYGIFIGLAFFAVTIVLIVIGFVKTGPFYRAGATTLSVLMILMLLHALVSLYLAD